MDKNNYTPEIDFIDSWCIISTRVHTAMVKKGFWPIEENTRNDGELIALCHSELSEALEALRHGNPPSDHIPEFTGVEEELADLIIRVMDMANGKGWRVASAIINKIEFNEGRPYKHGKEF